MLRIKHSDYQPEISIIIPVFNAGKCLSRALTSVLKSDWSGIEVLVMDGLSTDNTEDILSEFRSDSRLRYYREADNGVYDAMNKGITLAKGKRFYFLGADDVLLCNLKNLAALFSDEKVIYYGDVLMGAQRYDGPFDWQKLLIKNIAHQSLFYPASLFKNQRYELKYPIYADYAFNLKNWYHPRYRWEYIPELIAQFTLGGLSSTQNDPQFFNDFPSLKNRYIHRRKGLKGKIRAWLDL